ncbi:DNA topoisomerase III [Salipiger mucosus DSM 16094]|uniref:DNA topoisomerase III n=1 Tax=Salipiger mucosus DSM 16094 TaxID=1123237 RepID=S9RZV6_9RHOB|nr:DNA topoisomerase III [Salipiger mucosus DSM 16094]
MAQKLYETHKLTTYPRSDSRYLPTAILKDEAPGILQALRAVDGALGKAADDANPKLKSDAWNDGKVSDHHAIIPTSDATAAKIANLEGVEANVFDIIAKTFVAQFYPDQRWKALTAKISVEEDHFSATGRKEIDAGWKVVFTGDVKGDDEEDDEEGGQSLPTMQKSDPVTADKGEVKSKRTTPPPAFTDGTLIAAMSNVHRFVPDSEAKKRLKENEGLGTEATRANMIEKLISRKFLQRKGKNKLVSTLTGQSVVQALPQEVTDPALTAIWEGYLDKVSRGDLDYEKFMEGQTKNVEKRVQEGKEAEVKIKGVKTIQPLEGHGETCQKCGQGKMVTREVKKGKHKGKKFLSCDRYPDCDAVHWPKPKVDPIEGHGETCPKCQKGKMVTRMIQKGDHKGKKFLSCDQYPECDSVQWPKPKPIEGHGKPCPKCSDGIMETRKSKKGTFFLGCNNYPNCDAVEFQKDKVKPMKGDGETCTKCKNGTMRTKKIHKGDQKGKTFLACNQYPECKNAVWPD